MAKQLLLIRHAKSDWGNFDLKDFDRPLNQRGLQNAPEMGERLFIKNILPDGIVSSPALRAITTAQLMANKIAFNSEEIIQNPNIYLANDQQLLSIVTSLNNNLNIVALFGHNPGITDFANYLTHTNIYNLPTCGMVYISFDTDNWKTVSGGTGQLLWDDYPKKV